MNRLAVALAALAFASCATSQSELATSVAAQLDTAVVEEAVNASGTQFVMLTAIPRALGPDDVEEALKEFMLHHESGSIAIVYPAAAGRPYAHDASFGFRGRGGVVFTSTSSWVRLAQDAQNNDSSLREFSIRDLEYTFGAGRLLDSSAVAVVQQTNRARSAPANGCVSSTSASGSRITCYTDGHVTYRSTCTVDSRGNISCRSDSY
jgi:hypothetical protein